MQTHRASSSCAQIELYCVDKCARIAYINVLAPWNHVRIYTAKGAADNSNQTIHAEGIKRSAFDVAKRVASKLIA